MSKRTIRTRLAADDDAASARSGDDLPELGRSPLVIDVKQLADRTVVAVSGEIDVASEQALRDGLYEAVHHSARGIDLDLDDVHFCDSHGLDVLLCVRRRALHDGKSVTIRAPGAEIRKLLSATGTLSLFAVTPHGESDGQREGRDEGRGERDRGEQDPYTELAQLRRAMQTRPVIDLARGILMASFGLSAERAWEVLVSVSQHTNTKLHQVADDLVGAVTGDALPEEFQELLATAVSKARTAPGEETGQPCASRS